MFLECIRKRNAVSSKYVSNIVVAFISSSLWSLWSPKWPFRTWETVVFRWQILSLRRCFKISHGCAVDLWNGIGTVLPSVVKKRRNSCRKWLRALSVDGLDGSSTVYRASAVIVFTYCILSTKNTNLWFHIALKQTSQP